MFLKLFWLTKHFPSFLKKEKKEKNKKEHSQYIFQPLCVWSGLFCFLLFCFVIFWISSSSHTSSAEQVIKKHRSATVLHLLSLSFYTTQLHRPFSLYCSPPPYAVRLREVQKLRHDSEHGVVATDARPDLFVVLFGVANLVELRLWRHKWWRGRWVQEQTLDRRHLNSHIYLHICSLQVVLFPLFRQEGYFIYFKQTAVTAAGKSLHTDGPSSDLPDGGCVWKANVKALKVSDFSKWLPMSTWQLLLMSSVNHCAGFLCLIPVYHLNWTSWVVFYHFTNCRVTAAQQEPQNWAKLTS